MTPSELAQHATQAACCDCWNLRHRCCDRGLLCIGVRDSCWHRYWVRKRLVNGRPNRLRVRCGLRTCSARSTGPRSHSIRRSPWVDVEAQEPIRRIPLNDGVHPGVIGCAPVLDLRTWFPFLLLRLSCRRRRRTKPTYDQRYLALCQCNGLARCSCCITALDVGGEPVACLLPGQEGLARNHRRNGLEPKWLQLFSIETITIIEQYPTGARTFSLCPGVIQD